VWIIPDALAFPGIAGSLHIQRFVIFPKPDGRPHDSTVLAKRSQADVLPAPNFGRDGHEHIVRELTALVRFVTAYVAHEAVGVLQARDAQMDERALKAPQKRAGEGGR